MGVTTGLCVDANLLSPDIPSFLGIRSRQGAITTSATLAIGALVLDTLLAMSVILWGYGGVCFPGCFVSQRDRPGPYCHAGVMGDR
ncbi:hypothetical protein [Tamilnaduibacter salinus]|nr:hypothetical protein [Tamilnaduibacter salinus]